MRLVKVFHIIPCPHSTIAIALLITGHLIFSQAASPHDFITSSRSDTSGRNGEFVPWWDAAWIARKPITVSLVGGGQALYEYQIQLKIFYESKMKTDFSDLRFIFYNRSSGANVELPYFVEKKNDGVEASVWVRVPIIQPGPGTVFHMYYANPAATSTSSGDRTFDFYDDFESSSLKNGWVFWNPGGDDSYSLTERPGWLRIKVVGTSDTWESVNVAPFMYWTHPSPNSNFVVQTKEDGSGVGANSRHSLLAYIRDFSLGRENKGYWGAYTSTTSCKFEADGFRGNVGDTGATVHYLRFRKSSSTLYYDWSIDMTNWTNTGSYSLPSMPAYWGLGGKSWSSGGSFNADFDYFLVRKYALQEPQVSIGQEERPFRFVSFSVTPELIDEGESVWLNATFENLISEIIGINVSFREGDDFHSSDLIWSREVDLSPSEETCVSYLWTPAGGPHTIWLAVSERPVGSRDIYVNRYPLLSPIMDQVVSQGKNFKLLIFAEDADGDRLNWSEDCPLFNITPRGPQSAEINFTPTNDDVGNYTVNITVSDPRGCKGSTRFKLTVKNVNDYPVIEPIKDQSVAQDTEFRYK
ncbi:MAG: DUF2341 domain-containing protein, partial [Thermoplasmata archaeon]